ncbi:MAG TPA: PKD domain-containing protein [Solirubrobacterales bacterium]|nr:PKD domain-containing protein [Solirubrobacterales bacterium]
MTVAGFSLLGGTPAAAVILPPTTIDGPSTEGLSVGDVAMAPDGTGGLVYTKSVAGVAHVFASRYDNGSWSAPMQVDWDRPFEASQPRIAAGRNGRLLVVWVTPVATVDGASRSGLLSASLGPGAKGFGPSLLVDPNVGDGAGVDPSLAGSAPGKAVVAYRVVTLIFGVPGQFTNSVPLRPGDVMADVRVARLEGDRWSRLGPVNRFPAASMRPPGETNGPEVAVGSTGRAVVAWQEPDLTGVARILVRRVTGTTLGPVYAASPEAWEGRPVTDDATALGLDVTGFDMARVAVRVDGAPGSPLRGQRVFMTSLGSSYSTEGGEPVGPEPADGGGSGAAPIGPPAVAASDEGGGDGSLRLAFSAGSVVRLVGVDEEGRLQASQESAGPIAEPGTAVVAAVDPEGGGIVAYEALDEIGSPTVAVRQEFPLGGSQTGLLYGPLGGQISQLLGGGSGSGDALLAFRQGESGRFAIVADRVAAPPARFRPTVPKRWVPPRRAKVRWPVAPSVIGGVRYALLLDGRVVRAGLTRRKITPPPALLGSGVRRVQVMATDRLGQDVLTRPVKLRVDDRPPRLRVRVQRDRGIVALKLRDAHSGLMARATRVRFGDGEGVRGGARFRHLYAGAGRYTIRVRARDRTRNTLTQLIEVVVR